MIRCSDRRSATPRDRYFAVRSSRNSGNRIKMRLPQDQRTLFNHRRHITIRELSSFTLVDHRHLLKNSEISQNSSIIDHRSSTTRRRGSFGSSPWPLAREPSCTSDRAKVDQFAGTARDIHATTSTKTSPFYDARSDDRERRAGTGCARTYRHPRPSARTGGCGVVGGLRGWLQRDGYWSDEESGERKRSADVAHVTE
jgi:hypothetical protein